MNTTTEEIPNNTDQLPAGEGLAATPCSQFGKLRLSVEGTGNGRGFDIFYDFGESHDFVEFTSKPEFYFIQPWMQFPSKEYSDTCKLVSIEVVRRFNEFEGLKRENERMRGEIERRISSENAPVHGPRTHDER